MAWVKRDLQVLSRTGRNGIRIPIIFSVFHKYGTFKVIKPLVLLKAYLK